MIYNDNFACARSNHAASYVARVPQFCTLSKPAFAESARVTPRTQAMPRRGSATSVAQATGRHFVVEDGKIGGNLHIVAKRATLAWAGVIAARAAE